MAELCQVGRAGLALFKEKTYFGRWYIRRRLMATITTGRKARFWDVWRYETKALKNIADIESKTIDIDKNTVAVNEKRIWDLADLIAVQKGVLTQDVMRSFTVKQASEHLRLMLWDRLQKKLDMVAAYHNPRGVIDDIEKYQFENPPELEPPQKQLGSNVISLDEKREERRWIPNSIQPTRNKYGVKK